MCSIQRYDFMDYPLLIADAIYIDLCCPGRWSPVAVDS